MATSRIYNNQFSTYVNIDKNGETRLHREIRLSKNYTELRAKLVNLGDEVYDMAQVVNNYGQTILDIAFGMNFSENDKPQIMKLLKVLLLSNKIKSLSKKISHDSILKKIDSKDLNDALTNNIKIGCVAANKAREIIKNSTTHPSMNEKPNEEMKIAADELRKLRNDTYDSLLLHLQKDKNFSSLYNLVKTFEEKGMGNCREYAYAALYYAQQEDENVNLEIMSIKNGDHVFLVIGRDPLSAINDPTTWGNAAVVCDPWYLAVYPAYEIKNELKNYKCYQDDYDEFYHNLIFSYNPQYHQLDSRFCFPYEDEKSKINNTIRNNLKIFKVAKMTGNTQFSQLDNFIEKSNQDCNGRALENGIKALLNVLHKNPIEIIKIMEKSSQKTLTLLSSLTLKMQNSNCQDKLAILFNKCLNELVDASIYHLNDINTLIDLMPAYSDKIICNIISREAVMKRVFESNAKPEEILKRITNKFPKYSVQFEKFHQQAFEVKSQVSKL